MISRSSINGAFRTKRLGEVVEFLDSQRRPVTESDRRAGPYPYFGANGQQGTIDDYIFDEPLVLLAEDGGHFGEANRAIAYRISGKTWVNNHAHVLRPKPDIDLAFLCRVLENYDVTPFVTGTTRGKLTKAGASEIVIPVPPLAEQRRIAEMLDRAEALRAMRRAAIGQLGSMNQSLFLDLFGPNGKHRSKCTTAPLEVLSRSINDGVHKTPTYVARGVPFVTVKNIVTGALNLTDTKFITEDDHKTFTKRTKPERGDVLVSKDGTIGVPCPITIDEDFSIFVSVALIKPKSALIDQSFLVAQFQSDSVQRQIRAGSKGIAIRHLHLEDFKRLVFIVPPIDLQHEFARRVAAMENLKTSHRASLAELDALFASLQYRAFRGEL